MILTTFTGPIASCAPLVLLGLKSASCSIVQEFFRNDLSTLSSQLFSQNYVCLVPMLPVHVGLYHRKNTTASPVLSSERTLFFKCCTT